MKLHIYNLQGLIHEGESDSITLPASEGQISILTHHIPLVTILKKGSVITKSNETTGTYKIEGGMAYTDGSQLVILAD